MGADWPTIGVMVALGRCCGDESWRWGDRVDALDGWLTKAIGDA